MTRKSYEEEIVDNISSGKGLPGKLDISTVKYFWQASPLTRGGDSLIPKFLRSIRVLENFTDNELRILSKSLHLRTFDDGETVFKQGDLGVGFYLILSGHVDIVVESDNSEEEKFIITLEKGDYFGELALLQNRSIRNATVVSRETTELLGIFKPDMEELISSEPVVATKILQSVSTIVANRLFSITQEVKRLKHKIAMFERERDKERELNEQKTN